MLRVEGTGEDLGDGVFLFQSKSGCSFLNCRCVCCAWRSNGSFSASDMLCHIVAAFLLIPRCCLSDGGCWFAMYHERKTMNAFGGRFASAPGSRLLEGTGQDGVRA